MLAHPTQNFQARTSWWDEEDDANELLYGRTVLNFPDSTNHQDASRQVGVGRTDPELHLHAADPDVAYDSKD